MLIICRTLICQERNEANEHSTIENAFRDNCDTLRCLYNVLGTKSSDESNLQWVDMAAIAADVLEGATEAGGLAAGAPAATVVDALVADDLVAVTVVGGLGAAVRAEATVAAVPVPRGLQASIKLLQLAIGHQVAIRPQINLLQHGEHAVPLPHTAILAQRPLRRQEHIEQHSPTAERRAKQKLQLEER